MSTEAHICTNMQSHSFLTLYNSRDWPLDQLSIYLLTIKTEQIVVNHIAFFNALPSEFLSLVAQTKLLQTFKKKKNGCVRCLCDYCDLSQQNKYSLERVQGQTACRPMTIYILCTGFDLDMPGICRFFFFFFCTDCHRYHYLHLSIGSEWLWVMSYNEAFTLLPSKNVLKDTFLY